MNPKPRLLLLGLPFVDPAQNFAEYGFCEMLKRFPKMIRMVGYEVHYFCVEGDGADSAINVEFFNRAEAEANKQDCIKIDSAFYRRFNLCLGEKLSQHYQPGDIVLCPYGHGHALALSVLPKQAATCEFIVGYDGTFSPFRVFPSWAWYHWHCGRYQQQGSDYNWRVPHYFNADDFKVDTAAGSYVLYFGRLSSHKGLDIFSEVARHRKDLRFVLCGQGDPAPWIAENVGCIGTIKPHEKSELLGGAIAVLCPTRYLEPFGSVAVEAMLCGRPVLSSDFGAYTETVAEEFRCRTIGQWLNALSRAEQFTARGYNCVAEEARARFSLEAIGPRYAEVFQQISDLNGEGWFSRRPSSLWPTVSTS